MKTENNSNNIKIMQRQERNPRNYVTDLFQKLTRIFSGPLVSYRRQTERTLRNRGLNKYSSKFFSTSGQEFKKSQFNPFENLSLTKMVNHQRALRYADFAAMEFNPDISSVIDIVAEEMTTYSSLEPILKIKCSNEEIREVLNILYYNILNVEFNLFGWSRNLCKYGDFFLYLDIDEEKGIKNVIGLPTEEIERLEGEDKDNPNYVQFQWNARGVTFENWQVAHFRILGNDKYAPMGTSILDPARRIFRQLTLIENAVMAYRIVRSPERRVFYIDVGNIPPQDVETFMQKIMKQMKSSEVVDATTSNVDLRYSSFGVENDYFIPTRAGSATKIETLPGGTYTGDIEDVKYLRDKLFSALKVPMSYLSRGESGSEDKSSLCLSLDTKIPLLDGRVLELKDIIKEFEDKKENNMICYSIDIERMKIIPGKIKWAGITQKNVKKMLRIWLDNLNYFDCTENHEIVMRDGTKKQAHMLKENDSVMPLYFKENVRNYKEIMHPFNGEYEFVHKMVALENNIYVKGKVVHHLDANKYNNNPENLDCSMTWLEHRRFHQKHIEQTLMREDVIEQRKKDYKNPDSNWNKWIKSKEHRQMKSELMKKETTTKGCGLYNWIHSEEHKIQLSKIAKEMWLKEGFRENIIEKNKKMWKSEEYKERHSGKNHWSYKQKKQYTFEWLIGFCKEKKIVEKRKFLKESPIGLYWLEKILKENNFNRWRDFRKQCLTYNHKIVKIEILETNEDVGCLTIDNEFHNFAIDSGIFVGNSSKDIRFARTIQRLQKSVISELEKIGLIHLYVLGFRGEDLLSFKLGLNNPSKITELQELEHWRTKFDVASAATDGFFSRRWIAEKLFNLSDEEYLRNQREMFYDRQLDAQWAAIAEPPESDGSSVSDFSGAGDLDVGTEGDEEEKDDVLLSKPDEANIQNPEEPVIQMQEQDKSAYLTPGSKGKWYTPEKFDKRSMGARKRHMQSMYSKEKSSNAMRNIFQGASGMMSLSKGITEQKEVTIYKEEEKKLLKENQEVKMLIELLENRGVK